MNVNWQLLCIGLLLKVVSEVLSGSVLWDGKVVIELLYYGNVSYKVDINGDLKNVSSCLFLLVSKFVGEFFLVKINVVGGLSSFDLIGFVGVKNYINSCWLFNYKLMLDRVIFIIDSKGYFLLFDQFGIEFNLLLMDGVQWLVFFENGVVNEVSSSVFFLLCIVLCMLLLVFVG